MSDGIEIERGEHTQDFVIIGNAESRDSRVSFRARGLHHYLLSLPPGWRVTTAELGKENPEGRDAIRTALSELVSLGYVTKRKRQDESGHWSTVMTVHGRPQPLSQTDDAPEPGESSKAAGQTEDGIPGVGNPGVGFPGAKQKTVTENGEDLKMASRRAHASGASATWSVRGVVDETRAGIAEVHGQAEADDLSDGEVYGFWTRYVGRKVRDIPAYVAKILGDAPYLDTFMASVEPRCTQCQKWDEDCDCPLAA